MFKNRNGYWMTPEFGAMFAPDDGAGTGGDGGNGTGGTDGGNDGGNNDGGNGAGSDGAGNSGTDGNGGDGDLASQLEQLKAELARQKAAVDKATHEASDYKKAMNEAKKQLTAKMTQAEIDEANKKEAEEKQAARLAELEKEVARTKTSKSVMAKLGVNEEEAGKIAEYMIGCEDIDNALLLIQKTWEAKEKALRIEFGKIPGPGAGGGSEDKEMQEALALAKELGERKARVNSSIRDQLKGLAR